MSFTAGQFFYTHSITLTFNNLLNFRQLILGQGRKSWGDGITGFGEFNYVPHFTELIALCAKAGTMQPLNAIPHGSPACPVCGLCSRLCACDKEMSLYWMFLCKCWL